MELEDHEKQAVPFRCHCVMFSELSRLLLWCWRYRKNVLQAFSKMSDDINIEVGSEWDFAW